MVCRLMLMTCSVAVFGCSTSVDDPSQTGTLKAAVDSVQRAVENELETASNPAKMAATQPAQVKPQKTLKSDPNSVPKTVLTCRSAPTGPSTKSCMNYYELVMDQRGQVKDQCPIECKENPNRYSENDLVDEDTNMGLMVLEDCYKPCIGSSVGPVTQGRCRQKMLRQQLYSSSGLQWWRVRARVSRNVS